MDSCISMQAMHSFSLSEQRLQVSRFLLYLSCLCSLCPITYLYPLLPLYISTPILSLTCICSVSLIPPSIPVYAWFRDCSIPTASAHPFSLLSVRYLFCTDSVPVLLLSVICPEFSLYWWFRDSERRRYIAFLYLLYAACFARNRLLAWVCPLVAGSLVSLI